MVLFFSFPAFSSDPRLPRNAVEWLMTGGIVFSSLAAQLLMNQEFRYCKSWEGGLIVISEVVFTALLGVVFLGEIFGGKNETNLYGISVDYAVLYGFQYGSGNRDATHPRLALIDDRHQNQQAPGFLW
jgi:hypothetical protein